ncbi:hypothetical protein LINPERHAP2_LOCUS4930 [Linum perenne]
MVLQEQVKGTKSCWVGVKGEDALEMLLGLEIMRRLTEKRSAMEAKSRKLGGVGR